MTPHESMGLPADASLDDIHERFRFLGQTQHPRFGGDAEGFRRLQEAYAEFVAARCEELGVTPEEELALAQQDPWAEAAGPADGTPSFGSGLAAGIHDLDRYVIDRIDDRARGLGLVNIPKVEIAGEPMSFAGLLLSAALGLLIAMLGLHFAHPEVGGRLLALHAIFYGMALAVFPAIALFVTTTHDARGTRSMWIGAALTLGVAFARLPPLPFLVKAEARQRAEEAAGGDANGAVP